MTCCPVESRVEQNCGNLVNLRVVATLENKCSEKRPALFRLWLFGSWMLCAEVGSKLFVTMFFVMLLHFIERGTGECTRRLKLPVTLGAAETLKILALNPFQTAWHLRTISSRCAKQHTAILPACNGCLTESRSRKSVPQNGPGALGCKPSALPSRLRLSLWQGGCYSEFYGGSRYIPARSNARSAARTFPAPA